MTSSLVTSEDQQARLAGDICHFRSGQREGEGPSSTPLPSSLRVVWTRRALLAKIHKELCQLSLTSPPLTLVFLKVQLPPHLGAVFSSSAKETLLAAVVNRVGDVLRARDFLTRYKDNVLVIVLPRVPLSGATAVAERVRLVVDEMGAVVAPASFGMRAQTQVRVARPHDTVRTVLSPAKGLLSLDKRTIPGHQLSCENEEMMR
jgi:GGDEF domain-containing protein